MTTGRTIARLLTTATVTAVAAITLAAPSTAATTKFKSCDSMHQTYQYGVAVSKKASDRAVKDGMHRPPVKTQVYSDSYKTLDRDKDGVMCEVPR